MRDWLPVHYSPCCTAENDAKWQLARYFFKLDKILTSNFLVYLEEHKLLSDLLAQAESTRSRPQKLKDVTFEDLDIEKNEEQHCKQVATLRIFRGSLKTQDMKASIFEQWHSKNMKKGENSHASLGSAQKYESRIFEKLMSCNFKGKYWKMACLAVWTIYGKPVTSRNSRISASIYIILFVWDASGLPHFL